METLQKLIKKQQKRGKRYEAAAAEMSQNASNN